MGKKAPDPTPPKETSAATTGTNVSTAIANAHLGNVNQVTPDGSITYDQTGDYSWTDPYTGQSYNVPQFTATQTLSDQQQAIKNQGDAASLNLATLANDQSAFLNQYMSDPFSYSPGEHEEWALNLYDNLNNDAFSRQDETLRARLSNQGLKQGTEAYDRALENLYGARQTGRDKFLLDSYQTGMGTALTERNQPINEITALLSGGQVSQPNFVNPNAAQVQGTDNAAIIGNYDNQLMNQWAQNQAAMGSALSGVGGLFALSDERAKEDKEKIGETKDGLGIYSYRYKGSPKTEIGLMAQEVVKKKPRAVAKRPDGLMAVNYKEALS